MGWLLTEAWRLHDAWLLLLGVTVPPAPVLHGSCFLSSLWPCSLEICTFLMPAYFLPICL